MKIIIITFNNTCSHKKNMGRDSSVGIATRYVLDGPGIQYMRRTEVSRKEQ